MSGETVKLAVADGVATVTLNRPDALNSFTAQMHQALAAVLDRIEADDSAKVVVLTGAGRGFCAGQDLNERKREVGAPPPDLGETLEQFYNPLVRRLYNFPLPTIASVNGVAAGAGCSLALACDIAVAARSARFIQAFAKIGLSPDSGGTWLLPRAIGRAKALGMALTAEPMGAQEAERLGLIWKVVDDEALAAHVAELAAGLAAGPTLGLRRIKQSFAASAAHSLDQQLDLERDIQRELGRSEDYAEGTAAFLEKRKPRYTGK